MRLSRCQLSCAWCDTPYTWDRTRYDLGAESRRMTQAEVWHAVKAIDAGLVVITGGEPLLQQDRLVWLADMCRATGRWTEIETNGAVVPTRGIAGANRRFNVSLKLANSGMPPASRLRPEAIRALASTGKAVWKFVVTSPADLDEITELQQRYGLHPVWVMPEGTTSEQILRRMRRAGRPGAGPRLEPDSPAAHLAVGGRPWPVTDAVILVRCWWRSRESTAAARPPWPQRWLPTSPGAEFG